MSRNARSPALKLAAAAGAVVALAFVGGGACDDRIRPQVICSQDSECAPGEVCQDDGACRESANEPAVVEPEPTVDGGTPEPAPPTDAGSLDGGSPEPESEDAGPPPEPEPEPACQDLAENNAAEWGAEHAFETPQLFTNGLSQTGATSITILTSLQQPGRLVFPKDRDRSFDLTEYDRMVFALQGTSSTDVFAAPVVILEDCDGNSARFVSLRGLESGADWKAFSLPITQTSAAWTTTGSVDFSRVRSFEFEINAAGGYSLSVDGLGFIAAETNSCPLTCPDCGGRGTCDTIAGLHGCACECMDLADGNASAWGSEFDPANAVATTILVDDTSFRRAGGASIRADTDAGFDWALVYPGARSALWNLNQVSAISFWARADNDNDPDWQGAFPTVELEDDLGGTVTLTPEINSLSDDWAHHLVPIGGGDGWVASGSAVLSRIQAIEFHADTWDFGFSFFIDGVAFRRADGVCSSECLGGCGAGTCVVVNGMPTCQ